MLCDTIFLINQNSLFWVPTAIRVQLCYSTKFEGGESGNLDVNICNQPEAVAGKKRKTEVYGVMSHLKNPEYPSGKTIPGAHQRAWLLNLGTNF